MRQPEMTISARLLKAVYGEASLRCQAEFQKHRHTLATTPTASQR